MYEISLNIGVWLCGWPFACFPFIDLVPPCLTSICIKFPTHPPTQITDVNNLICIFLLLLMTVQSYKNVCLHTHALSGSLTKTEKILPFFFLHCALLSQQYFGETSCQLAELCCSFDSRCSRTQGSL